MSDSSPSGESDGPTSSRDNDYSSEKYCLVCSKLEANAARDERRLWRELTAKRELMRKVDVPIEYDPQAQVNSIFFNKLPTELRLEVVGHVLCAPAQILLDLRYTHKNVSKYPDHWLVSQWYYARNNPWSFKSRQHYLNLRHVCKQMALEVETALNLHTSFRLVNDRYYPGPRLRWNYFCMPVPFRHFRQLEVDLTNGIEYQRYYNRLFNTTEREKLELMLSRLSRALSGSTHLRCLTIRHGVANFVQDASNEYINQLRLAVHPDCSIDFQYMKVEDSDGKCALTLGASS